MKFLIALVLILSVVSAYTTSEQLSLWKNFVVTYNKTYTSATEMQARFEIFKENLDIAAALDAADEHATYGVTVFMDLSKGSFLLFFFFIYLIFFFFKNQIQKKK